MGRGGRKKKKKTPTVVPESKPLACLICYCRTKVFNSSVLQFYGFVFDPTEKPRDGDGDGDGEGFVTLCPRFRLDGIRKAKFCIANSVLYVFELCKFSGNITKSVYSLDLSLVLNASSTEMVVIEKSKLEKCSEMKSPKTTANIILTPKGKILIFSPQTSPIAYREFDFELFDPDTKQCRSLPQLPLNKRLRIHGYGFLSDSLFMISTDGGKYAIDLDGNSGWEEHFRYPHTPRSYFLAFGNEIYSITGVVRIQDSHATPLSGFDPPLSQLPDSVKRRMEPPEQYYNHSHSICLLGADKEFILCFAQAAFVPDELNDRPCILFDVYRSDSDPSRKKKASFRFTADIPGHLMIFISEGLFRIV